MSFSKRNFLKKIPLKFLGVLENQHMSRPRLIRDKDVGQLKWKIVCQGKRVSFLAENGQYLLWKPYGGLSMASEVDKQKKRNSLWLRFDIF